MNEVAKVALISVITAMRVALRDLRVEQGLPWYDVGDFDLHQDGIDLFDIYRVLAEVFYNELPE